MAEPLNYRRIFESAPGAYVVLDPDTTIVAVTDSYLETVSQEREAILGRPLLEVLFPEGGTAHPRQLHMTRESLEKVIATKRPHRMPVQKYLLAPPGSHSEERYWKPVNTPVVVDGEVRWIIHSIEHVSDFVRMEKLEGERVEATNQLSLLREADREKDEFIAIISHELRTPMTSILGWTRMLALGLLDDETRKEALEALERSTLAQAKLIEDLLDESRIASGKLRLELRDVDMRAVVTDALSMARPAAEAHGVRLEADCTREPCHVYGDPARIQQAVGNLLGNAIKFTPEGGSVLARLSVDGDHALLEVIDTGKGMDAALVPLIFERFRQGDEKSAERQSGLGLGLSITRHVIEMHGGTVSATSAGPGRGSTFAITLPLQSAAGWSEMVERDSGARTVALPQLGAIRILIVEDEVDNRKVIAAALRQSGAEVECAASAAAAWETIERSAPDVIICDVALPDRDGCDFIAELRAHGDSSLASTPALALTVLGRPGEQQRITAAGFNIFRQKPIDPLDLAFDVERLARERGQKHSGN